MYAFSSTVNTYKNDLDKLLFSRKSRIDETQSLCKTQSSLLFARARDKTPSKTFPLSFHLSARQNRHLAFRFYFVAGIIFIIIFFCTNRTYIWT